MNNPIISVVGLGKMGLGIYKRLCHENIILYGYDNNSKICLLYTSDAADDC